MLVKTNSIASARVLLRAINAEIEERRRYFNAQETQIKELVESGNTQLMGLHHDIMVARQQLREIKTDIRTAAQDKVRLNQDLEQIRGTIHLTVIETSTIGFIPASS